MKKGLILGLLFIVIGSFLINFVIADDYDVSCEADDDCACGRHIDTGECFMGNKDYVNTSNPCPDFCSGIAGNFITKCIKNQCAQVDTSINKTNQTDYSCQSDSNCVLKDRPYCCGESINYVESCYHLNETPEELNCEGEGSCLNIAKVYNCNCEDNKCENIYEDDDDGEDKNETEKEDCWQCSKWNDCINHTQTRTCTQIVNCTGNEEKPKETKKCKFGKKIKDYYINNDCPEECTCTGSTIKCELASGRIMTIHAGKSGNLIVQVKGTNMSTSVNLYKDENGTLTGVFKNNKTRIINVLPDEIEEKIKARLEEKDIQLDENGIYQIHGKKKARLFFLIPIREKVNAQINAETGKVIRIRNSWWGFLAKDIKE